MKKPMVTIVMGSKNDYEAMIEAKRILDEFGIANEVLVVSAHRTPEKCRDFARNALKRGIKVIIAGAGKAAHLAGVIASYTTLPVIGVPLDASLGGLDALLSTVQMPVGVPVATMAIGRSGAVNAGLMAVEILGLENPELMRKLNIYRKKQQREVKLPPH
uniref:N5-carboxyaminoimidazole ribonucleotide mutase n=1 Tax=candidate division WOR-3 bacterium TaxID=2052148 RepID=A0A7V3PSE6_UNCW3